MNFGIIVLIIYLKNEFTKQMNPNPNRNPGIVFIRKGIHLVEVIGLVLIAIATIIAGVMEIKLMIENQRVTLGDLLLLFLYLEILAMVKVYLETGKLPIRFPLYIAIIALARYLIIEVKYLEALELIAVSITILIIGITLIIIRYGHIKLPYISAEEVIDKFDMESLVNEASLKKKKEKK